MRHVPVWLPLSLALVFAGCTDPNPTFVFDAATSAHEGGTGFAGSATEAGAPDGSTGLDAGTDASGGGQ
jgi:hypothetical protein